MLNTQQQSPASPAIQISDSQTETGSKNIPANQSKRINSITQNNFLNYLQDPIAINESNLDPLMSSLEIKGSKLTIYDNKRFRFD